MKELTYAQQSAAAASEAKAILREKAERTPAEQAAIDALNQNRWVLWHAEDYSLGVIRLLSNADLLRDKKYEREQAAADSFWAAHSERRRAAEAVAISQLDMLAQQAAERLESGDDPHEIAKWMRATRKAIVGAREQAMALEATS
jgi:hypothetical protein